MKKFLVFTGVLLCFYPVCTTPVSCAQWVSAGFGILTEKLLPSLFIPMLLTNFLILSPLKRFWDRWAGAPFGKLLSLPKEEGSVLLLSFLCGYPSAVVMGKQLVLSNQIDPPRFQRLCLLGNNCGIGFLFSFLGGLLSPSKAFCLFLGQFASVLLLSRCNRKKAFLCSHASPKSQTELSYLQAFLSAVPKTLTLLATVGGFVIFFSFAGSALDFFASRLPGSLTGLTTALRVMLELSTGCLLLKEADASLFFYALAVGWGGLCVGLQSASAGSPLPFPKAYWPTKALQAVLCGIFTFLFSVLLL